MSSESAPSTVRLSDYTALVRRQWAVVLVGLVLGAAAAGGYVATAPREYTSATSVLVTAATSTAGSSGPRANTDINLDTEAQLVRATETVSTAAGLLDDAESADDLAGRVTVTVPPNTDILRISFVAPTADGARAGAEAFAFAYLEARQASAAAAQDAEFEALQGRIDEVNAQLQELTGTIAGLPGGSTERQRAQDQADALTTQLAALGSQQNQVRAAAISPGRIVTQPFLPTTPSSPDVPMTVVAGALLGLLLGIGAATLRHRSDERIHTAEDLPRRTGVQVAAVVPTALRPGAVEVVAPSSADARSYARLRNVVTSQLESRTHRVVLVAGVRRGGGPVAANLAVSLARSGEDVVLVCADAYGATAAGLLGGVPSPGMADVVTGALALDKTLQAVPEVPGLRVLGPGRHPDRADALLQSRESRQVVERLQEQSSYVVVELPPTTEGTAAQTLVGTADLALLVVETERTTASDVVDALGQIETASRPVVGAVIVSLTAESAGHPVDDTVTAQPPAAPVTTPPVPLTKDGIGADSGRPGERNTPSGRSPAAR